MVETRSSADPEYTDADFQMVRRIAKQEAGIFIPDSKSTLVYSRVSRRVRESGLESFHAYLNFVQSPPGQAEMEKLVCALTTNVTSFFRERHILCIWNKMLCPHLRHGCAVVGVGAYGPPPAPQGRSRGALPCP